MHHAARTLTGDAVTDARFRCSTPTCALLLQRQTAHHHRPRAPPASEGGDFSAFFSSWAPCRSFEMLPEGQCAVEWDEWQIVRAMVRPNSTVLELGARFGTTSCVLSEAVGGGGVVVAVEPDTSAQSLLLRNLVSHRCANVHVVRGVVSSRPMLLGPRSGYGGVGTRTQAVSPSAVNSTRGLLPSVRLRRLEQSIGRRVDTLLVDCEGCIGSVLGEDSLGEALLRQLDLILIEEDGTGVPYESYWWPRLAARGFVRAWRSHAWYSTPSAPTQHTVWTKGNRNLACELYARHEREAGRTLRCSEDL